MTDVVLIRNPQEGREAMEVTSMTLMGLICSH